jgi:hypothetical protein
MMKRLALVLVTIPLACSLNACSSDPGAPARAGSPPQGALASDAGASGDAGPASVAAADGGAAAADAAPVPVDAALATIAMREISANAPGFASSSANYQTAPSAASDNDPLTAWSPTALPAWIAYDLSGAPASDRQNVLVVWNALHAGGYISDPPQMGAAMPTAYTIEINAAPGGTASPPADGWSQVAAVTGNDRNTVETPVALGGANWVRMSITAATDPAPAIDVDVFSVPHGATDAWMFMGDSITYMTMTYAWNDLPKLVAAARPDRRPAVIDAAIGGTNTGTAVQVIDETMRGFPGRYVVLAYGTNDNVSQGGAFQMETLVQHVLAAGKVPVVPHMPWSSSTSIQANGPVINAAIDALYAKYPEILRGPDLWADFMGRTDLIAAGDIHPNSMGQEFLRQEWAKTMAAVP